MVKKFNSLKMRNYCAYKVLGEWQSAREQLLLEHLYNYELGIHMGEKLWKNQHCNTLNVYKKLGTKSGEILDDNLEWEDRLTNSQTKYLPGYQSPLLLTGYN